MAIAIGWLGQCVCNGIQPGSGTGFDYATVKYNCGGKGEWVCATTDQEMVMTSPGQFPSTPRNVNVTDKARLRNGADYTTIKYNVGSEEWVVRYNGRNGRRTLWHYHDDSDNIYVTGARIGRSFRFDCATIKYNSTGTTMVAPL